MGSDRAADPKAADNELPQHKLFLPPDDVRRVVRGAGWDDDSEGVHVTYRLPNLPVSRNDILGFRAAGSLLE